MFSSGTTWHVTSINGEPFEAEATLMFGDGNAIGGKAVCNTYSGTVVGNAELFQIGPMAVTKMACPDMEKEGVFLQALEKMTKGEETDGQLILRGTGDAQMVFTPAPG